MLESGRVDFIILEGKPQPECSPALCARWEIKEVGEQLEADCMGASVMAKPGGW